MPLQIDGYTASVHCDGKELEEYGVKQEGARTVSCWIPSESGKVRVVYNHDPILAPLNHRLPSRSQFIGEIRQPR